MSLATKKKKSGFTLIELLVVISIIGLLASVVLVSLTTAKEKAKRTKAISDLRNIRTAMEQMSIDTGLGPNGCPNYDMNGGVETELDSPWSGLTYIPTLGFDGGVSPTSGPGQHVNDIGVPTVYLLLDPHFGNPGAPWNPPPAGTGYMNHSTNNPTGCGWTAAAISRWAGPYITRPGVKDPWGRPYVFDGDYDGYAVVLSMGPNGYDYDPAWNQDNIVIILGPQGL
jgi:prepilin-type N-terminal cleavage/methylation domain-containing protein